MLQVMTFWHGPTAKDLHWFLKPCMQSIVIAVNHMLPQRWMEWVEQVRRGLWKGLVQIWRPLNLCSDTCISQSQPLKIWHSSATQALPMLMISSPGMLVHGLCVVGQPCIYTFYCWWQKCCLLNCLGYDIPWDDFGAEGCLVSMHLTMLWHIGLTLVSMVCRWYRWWEPVQWRLWDRHYGRCSWRLRK